MKSFHGHPFRTFDVKVCAQEPLKFASFMNREFQSETLTLLIQPRIEPLILWLPQSRSSTGTGIIKFFFILLLYTEIYESLGFNFYV